MINIFNIVKGWTNVLLDEFNALPPYIKELSTERQRVCQNCPLHSKGVCSTKLSVKKGKEKIKGCGCPIIAKSMVLNEECPLDKW